MLDRLLRRVCHSLSSESFAACHECGIDGHFDFEHINSVLWLGKLLHGTCDIFWFLSGKCQAFLITKHVVVYERLKKKRHIQCHTFCAGTFYKDVFDLVDVSIIEWIVVQENFDGLRSNILQPPDAPFWQQ